MARVHEGEQTKFESHTFYVETPDGTMYVNVMEDNKREPIGIQISIGKAGASIAAWANALSAMLSLSLDKGAGINDIIKELSSITSDRARVTPNGEKVRSGPEGVFVCLMRYRRDYYKRVIGSLNGKISEEDGRPARMEGRDIA